MGTAGCALWQPRAPEPPLRVASAEQLLEFLRVREQALQTVKGLFTAQVKGSGLPIARTVHGTLFYRRPDALRLQAFNRFGGKLFDFTLEPGRYVLMLPQEGRVMTGSPAELDTQEGLSQPIRLSMFAMTGLIGIESVAPRDRVVLFEDEDRYRLDVHPAAGVVSQSGVPLRRIWFERRSFQVVREERLTPDGEVERYIELEDFRRVEKPSALTTGADVDPGETDVLVLPFTIMAESEMGHGSIKVTFSELIPNVPLGEKELRIAAGLPGKEQGDWREGFGS